MGVILSSVALAWVLCAWPLRGRLGRELEEFWAENEGRLVRENDALAAFGQVPPPLKRLVNGIIRAYNYALAPALVAREAWRRLASEAGQCYRGVVRWCGRKWGRGPWEGGGGI